MPTFDDALRGYAAKILARDGYRCRSCASTERLHSLTGWRFPKIICCRKTMPIGMRKRLELQRAASAMKPTITTSRRLQPLVSTLTARRQTSWSR
jgi:hypothetical protein